jgi:16S rRNA (guanine527-N7)-methyltransferase
MPSFDLKQCLSAIEKTGVPPVKALGEYVQKLLDWNEKINLTGASTPEEFALKHVADVWGATQVYQPGELIADIGSGGGVPGIILAIMLPNSRVTLVERRQKKAGVLSDLVKELGLTERVRVLARSFEEIRTFEEETEFWFRGFLPGPKLSVYLSEFFPRAQLGRLVLMKGPAWADEKLEIMNQKKVKADWVERFAEAAEIPYSLPQGAGERVLVVV